MIWTLFTEKQGLEHQAPITIKCIEKPEVKVIPFIGHGETLLRPRDSLRWFKLAASRRLGCTKTRAWILFTLLPSIASTLPPCSEKAQNLGLHLNQASVPKESLSESTLTFTSYCTSISSIVWSWNYQAWIAWRQNIDVIWPVYLHFHSTLLSPPKHCFEDVSLLCCFVR